MNRYEKLMLKYYQVLNNAWSEKVKESAKKAIRMLIQMKGRFGKDNIQDMETVINTILGEEFASIVRQENQIFIEKFFQLGLKDVENEVSSGLGIGLYGLSDAKQTAILARQQHFWVGNHFGADISRRFSESLYEALDKGYTIEKLRDVLSEQFYDIRNKGKAYWQGLAEHTALRVREFGRLAGYEKAGARGYKLINPMDNRTSPICWALVSQNKIYPLDRALEVRDKLLSIEMKEGSLEKAREQIKALAPWGKESNVVYDDEGTPIGITGEITPFPPFHWKCRTETRIVY